MSQYAENMAVELLGIAATEYNPAQLLKAKDDRGRQLLDVLIENEQVLLVFAKFTDYLSTFRLNITFITCLILRGSVYSWLLLIV